jgi:hypothetical protein
VTVRSARLASVSTTAATTTIYTVPAGHTTIVRRWTVLNVDATTALIALQLVPATGASVFIHPVGWALAQFAIIESNAWWVMEAGDVVRLLNFSGTPNCEVYMAGAQLAN